MKYTVYLRYPLPIPGTTPIPVAAPGDPITTTSDTPAAAAAAAVGASAVEGMQAIVMDDAGTLTELLFTDTWVLKPPTAVYPPLPRPKPIRRPSFG